MTQEYDELASAVKVTVDELKQLISSNDDDIISIKDRFERVQKEVNDFQELFRHEIVMLQEQFGELAGDVARLKNK